MEERSEQKLNEAERNQLESSGPGLSYKVEDLERERERLLKLVAGLKSELESARQERDQIQTTLSRLAPLESNSSAKQVLLEGQIYDMQLKHTQLMNEKNSLTQAYQDLQTQISQRDERFLTMQKENTSSALSLKNEIHTLQLKLDLALKNEADAQTRIGSLQSQIGTLIHDKNTQSIHFDDEIHKLRCELFDSRRAQEELRTALEKLQLENGFLQTSLSEANSKLQQAELDFKHQLTAREQEFRKELNRVRDENLPRFNIPGGRDERIKFLTDKLSELQAQYLDAEERATKFQTQLNRLMKEVENKAPQIQQQKINYEKLIVAYNDLSTKFQELSSTKDSLSAQIQTLHDHNSALNDEKTNLQRESTQLSAQVRTLLLENSRLKNGGVSVPTAPLTFKNVEELHTQNLQLLATLRKVQEESKQQVSSALAAAKKEIEQQRQTIQRLTSDLAAANLALENAKAKAAQAIPENYVNLELFYSQKKEELNQLRLDKARLESDNLYLSQRIQELDKGTIHLRAESDSLRHEKSALFQQLNYLEHDLEQVKTELLSEKSARNRLTLELETSKQLQELANSSQERAQSELKKIQEVYFGMLDNSETLERHFAEKQKQQQEEIQQLISEKSNLFALYRQKEAELSSMRSKWNEEVCKLKAELENYKLAVNYPLNLEKIGGELQDAYSLNNQLTAQLAQLTEEHTALQANYSQLTEQVERYRQMFTQAESSNMSFEELNTMRSEILMLRNELARKEREIVGYEEEIRNLKNGVLELQRALTDQARNLAEYSAGMSNLSEEKQSLKMSLKQASEERSNLVLEVESLRGQLVSNKQEMKNSILEKQRFLAGDTKEEPSSEEMYLKEEFAKAEKRAQDLESRCSSLSAELEECRREALSRPEVMHRLLSVVHKAYKLSQSQ